MSAQTRGERNKNPGNIERNSVNKWQGRISDADYRNSTEYRKNGGRFEVFSTVEWGIRALAVLLIAYQDRHGLRTVRGVIARWAPGHENDTGAYVDQAVKLTGFGPDAMLDLHSYGHIAPLVKAIITHENGRCIYSQATIDDGLFRAGVKPPGKMVASRAANVAKTAAVAGGGSIALVAAVTDGLQAVAPAIPIIKDITSLPWWLLLAGGTAASVAAVVWLVLRRQ
ncbi:structural protein [Inquilinus sp. Marseille-Q2685]|uniref:structural protein n=1 Tax=Inquilinus sp. Marseille-Q2685 TaxID=2866581 RepID=UPI001CE3C819|nr:structural protein [Inquilinus sp. Marseille-Q2685]